MSYYFVRDFLDDQKRCKAYKVSMLHISSLYRISIYIDILFLRHVFFKTNSFECETNRRNTENRNIFHYINEFRSYKN